MSSVLHRVAVTGAGGRLGSAVTAELAHRDESVVIAWRRPEYDLDSTHPSHLLDRDRPSLVIHAAAWTDVDGCAREPALAMRRNADAVASLAAACREREVPLVFVSTNEVFDGERDDGRGYAETDAPRPANPYGASKLAGERAAQEVFGAMPGLWIVRTCWLYGAPGNDFPEKIIAASDRQAADEPLRVVADETGSPTFARDLARALLELVQSVDGGLFHLVNAGAATRFEWAQAVLERCRPGRLLRPIARREFVRDSISPAWGVLECQAAANVGVVVQAWRSALTDYLASICATSWSDGLA